VKTNITLKDEFVEFMPEVLEEGILYVSMEYATVIHKCCCGCGNKVVTPLTPTDWKLTYDGHGISLDPSIGNWSFPCRSHYWIKGGRVKWSTRWSDNEVEAGRSKDRSVKAHFYGTPESEAQATSERIGKSAVVDPGGFWKNLRKRLWH
jgi:hypothetical protein